jgi:NADH-quinone oxidoreductase subunit M
MSATAVLAAETSNVTFPVLPALVALPAVGALVVALTPRRRPDLAKITALAFSSVAGAISIWMLASFKTDTAGFQYVSNHSWISSFGISWFGGVDGISLFLIVLTGVLFPIAIAAVDPELDPKPYYAWLLVLEAGCMGVFFALDLFMFFVFFEVVIVPMYFLIAKWGHGNRAYSATKFFLYTMFGSAFMLVGILALVFLHANESGGPVTFNLVTIAESQSLATVTARWIFLAFAVAFAVKVPLFPLHTWLPDAHTDAPTAGSVILASIMLKLGTYGFLRFGLYLFPEASVYFAPLMIGLGTVGIIYGAVVATMQRDLKRIIAYSSVAHLGFIVLGTFSLNREGLQGGLLQMINHGLSTGALFLLVGMIYERRHTREIAKLGGLQKVAPIFAAAFMLVMLSSIGLPGLNGFVGEFLVLLGGFMAQRWWTVVATAGDILAALYLLWAYQRVFHGEPDEDNASFPELTLREGLVLAPLIGLIVFMGVYPKPVLDRMEPSVNALIEHVEANVPRFHEPSPDRQPDVDDVPAAGSAEGGH